MPDRNRPGLPAARVVVSAGGIFVLFFAYFLVTASYLPLGRGPDNAAHNDAARFIYKHGRLAVFPADEDLLRYTPYGSTRALRPPLSYLLAGGFAKIMPESYRVERVFRYASALFGAGVAALTFIGLWVYFGSVWFSVLGATLIALMPQFTFISSYNNDDISAVFSATLLIVSLLVVLRYTANTANIALLGLSTGLVLISKLTAWLILPFVYAAWALLIRWQRERLFRLSAVWLVSVMLGGGWWIGFNVYHYGVKDPLLLEISQEISTRHARIDEPTNRGFRAQGIGYRELIIENHRHFIGESFKSTVGNLDWLRLRMGWPQYKLYLLIVVLAGCFYSLRLGSWLVLKSKSIESPDQDRSFLVETLLLASVAFQIFMYIRFNVEHDVQIQGKYLIPVFLPVWILFFASVRALKSGIDTFLELRLNLEARNVLYGAIGVASLVLTVGVHAHAIAAYVMPFYYPRAYDLNIKHFRQVNLQDASSELETIKASVKTINRSWEIFASAPDPQLILGAKFCEILAANSILKINLRAKQKDVFQIFVDAGHGFEERYSYKVRYGPGTSTLIFAIGTDKCNRIRFDPMRGQGQLTILDIAAAPLKITRPR